VGLITVMVSIVLLLLFALLAVPFVILGVVLGLALFIVGQVVMLPFRLLGAMAGPGVGIILFMIKAALLALLALFLLAGLVVGLAPLIPLLLVVAGVWLLASSARSRRRTV